MNVKLNKNLLKIFEQTNHSKKTKLNLDDLLDNSSSRGLEQGLVDTNFTRL